MIVQCATFSKRSKGTRIYFTLRILKISSKAFRIGYRQWRNWQGAREWAFPGKLNVKTGPPFVDILIFSILWVVAFCIFRGVFAFFKLV